MQQCSHCHNIHINWIEQMLCPLRPGQLPLMVERFGLLGRGLYRVTDEIRYSRSWQDQCGLILWIVAPGSAGSKTGAPTQHVRYIVEPFDGPQEYEVVDENDILSRMLSEVEDWEATKQKVASEEQRSGKQR